MQYFDWVCGKLKIRKKSEPIECLLLIFVGKPEDWLNVSPKELKKFACHNWFGEVSTLLYRMFEDTIVSNNDWQQWIFNQVLNGGSNFLISYPSAAA